MHMRQLAGGHEQLDLWGVGPSPRGGDLLAFNSPWFARDPGTAMRLALSESARECSPAARAAIANELQRMHLYPDSDNEPLRSAVAREWQVEPQQVVITNGADEALLMTVLALSSPGDLCVTTSQTFGGYAACFSIGSLKPYFSAVTTSGVDVAEFKANLTHARLAILCNPHNPTGGCLSPPVVSDIVRHAAESGAILIVDEAYGEFAEPACFASAWDDGSRNNVVVLRTFSKAYAMAGLRCGYAVASKALASRISAMRAAFPYSVNRLALAAGIAALQDKPYLAETVGLARRSRTLMLQAFRSAGIAVESSETNFVLAELGPRTDQIAQRVARASGIIIRDATRLGFPHHARIGTCLPELVEPVVNAILTAHRQITDEGQQS